MELWDLYDKDKNLTGKTHERGTWIEDGYYHLVVHVWLKNSEGKYLISRRDKTRKAYPLMLECPGGSVLAGETSLEGAIRETMEEVGIDLTNIEGKIIYTEKRESFHDYFDAWLFNYDGEADLNKATTNEVCEVLWMTKEEIADSLERNEFVPTLKYILEIGDNNEL